MNKNMATKMAEAAGAGRSGRGGENDEICLALSRM